MNTATITVMSAILISSIVACTAEGGGSEGKAKDGEGRTFTQPSPPIAGTAHQPATNDVPSPSPAPANDVPANEQVTDDAGSAKETADASVPDAGEDAHQASPLWFSCSGTATDRAHALSSVDWTLRVDGTLLCADAGGTKDCVPCTLDARSDTPQCPATFPGPQARTWTFAIDPVTRVAYVSAKVNNAVDGSSWTFACPAVF